MGGFVLPRGCLRSTLENATNSPSMHAQVVANIATVGLWVHRAIARTLADSAAISAVEVRLLLQVVGSRFNGGEINACRTFPKGPKMG